MTDSNQEQLSCLMDGELDPKAQEFLLRRLAGDAGMSKRWRRYHLVRACLHKELESADCIADRVRQALDSEPAAEAESTMPRWLRPVAGGAIAASVALVAIVGINSSLLERSQPEGLAEQPGFVSQPTSLDRTFSQQPVPVGYSEVTPEDRQRINHYVLRHNQASGGAGFIPYLPIVTGAPVEASGGESFEQDREPVDQDH
jgi:sigma-E factor negative regulatory protein RseA